MRLTIAIESILVLILYVSEGADVPIAIAQAAPPIDIETGWQIPSEVYCDQPYVAKLKDGTWLCVMTTGKGHEGTQGQHIVATLSSNKGRTGGRSVRQGSKGSHQLPRFYMG
jgi:hypothetical protein